MTKDEFIRAAAARAEVSIESMRRAVAAMSAVAATQLATDDLVRVPGFITLRAKHCDERPARNPKTGTPCVVPAGIRITAKPAASLLSAIDRAVPAE